MAQFKKVTRTDGIEIYINLDHVWKAENAPRPSGYTTRQQTGRRGPTTAIVHFLNSQTEHVTGDASQVLIP
jgi:hypothetical protein